jgi:hypothetical protein
MPQPAAAIRSYRIYFRDVRHGIASVREVDLASDDEAYQLADLMLDEQTAYPIAEVWDRARLVCTVRRDEQAAERDHACAWDLAVGR